MLAGIALTLVSLWYGQNHGLMPLEGSEESLPIDSLFDLMMTIGTGLFLLVQGVIIVVMIRFRRRQGDLADGPHIEGNIPLEILWTAIPAMIVMILAVYSFEVYRQIGGLGAMDHAMAHAQPKQQMARLAGAAIAAPLAETGPTSLADASSPEPVLPDSTYQLPGDAPYEIQALGLQYAWIFTYPDTGVVTGELHVPVGREILLNINAQDVLHAFWVPEYRLKQDAIPGRQTEIRFTPRTEGEYPVICAELCGPYHGAMKTKVIAHSPQEFAAWMQEQQVASASGLEQAIATVDPAQRSVEQILAPHVESLGIKPEVLQQLHPPMVHAHAS